MRNPTQSAGEVETPSEPTQSAAENTSTDEVTVPADPVVTVSVPQNDGEIVLSFGDDEPAIYKVTDGQVTVKDPDVDRFLRNIDGSSLVGGTPTAAARKE